MRGPHRHLMQHVITSRRNSQFTVEHANSPFNENL